MVYLMVAGRLAIGLHCLIPFSTRCGQKNCVVHMEPTELRPNAQRPLISLPNLARFSRRNHPPAVFRTFRTLIFYRRRPTPPPDIGTREIRLLL